jgi:hypothetical protein
LRHEPAREPDQWSQLREAPFDRVPESQQGDFHFVHLSGVTVLTGKDRVFVRRPARGNRLDLKRRTQMAPVSTDYIQGVSEWQMNTLLHLITEMIVIAKAEGLRVCLADMPVAIASTRPDFNHCFRQRWFRMQMQIAG